MYNPVIITFQDIYLPGNVTSCFRVVACDHHHFYACMVTLFYGAFYVFPYRVNKSCNAHEGHIAKKFFFLLQLISLFRSFFFKCEANDLQPIG